MHFLGVLTVVQGSNSVFSFQASLLTLSSIKQRVPGVGQVVFLCVLKVGYNLCEGGSVCSGLVDSSLNLQRYHNSKM